MQKARQHFDRSYVPWLIAMAFVLLAVLFVLRTLEPAARFEWELGSGLLPKAQQNGKMAVGGQAPFELLPGRTDAERAVNGGKH